MMSGVFDSRGSAANGDTDLKPFERLDSYRIPSDNDSTSDVSTNPAVFYVKCGRSRSCDQFTFSYKSDIVLLRFSGSELNFENTGDPDVKQVYITVPVAGLFNVEVSFGETVVSQLKHNVTSVDAVQSDHSSLICYGDKYESRWCRAKNICYSNRWFQFFGTASAKFNRSIMTAGSRPIPMDYPCCRKSIRFHTWGDPFPPANARLVVNERSFITCRWFSMQYLWHALFDYTVPLFWTQKLTGGVDKNSRIYTIDSNTSPKGFQYLSAFTNHEVLKLRVDEVPNNNTCWKDAVLGFPKSEYVVTPEKWVDTMSLPYEYPIEAFTGFREQMMHHFSREGVLDACEPDPKNPRVLIFVRNSTTRDIDNPVELEQAVKQWCPQCRVDSFIYRDETIGEQMEVICNASILISIHGSQLSHMVWMKIGDQKRKTSVIEILPYLYTCRDWYEQIANGAQIKYFKWLNTHRNNTRSGRNTESLYQKCLDGHGSCLQGCHDLLRDQRTVVNISEFESVFRSSLAYIS